ncbi:DNA-directed RNA polymerase II, putative [Eimeria tenella]|uniref:DNA-directed RNA polymerase II, putative n=1 Tax=Eimeria tenella TaxID=5802 RepID=U6KQA9_EIMTE|nr:DNA-directed RNA polymerase II, putative [Eimeria tenella]CDJ40151.1 DNA-directed RNA polymerase II, putative [Eimeria tenella]|eukprot:XP_013230904.1 DNA-directed RNA polymerase II, putative [Eimeria tenella]
MEASVPESLAGDLGPEFKNAKCLNLCELQLILGDQLRLSVARPAEAHNLIKASYEYASRFGKMTVRTAVVEIRKHLEREGDLQQFELALLVNLLPRTPDEAKAHIPSLIRLSAARLSRIIDTLEVFRVHAS